MNTIKYLKQSILPIALLLGGMAFTACTEDIEAGKAVDEGPFESVNRIEGMLLDRNSSKNESMIELRSDKHQTEVYFALTKVLGKGADVTIEVDPDYLATYNTAHGTDFKLFPTAAVTIAHDGALVIAPDEKNSSSVAITLNAAAELQEDQTYVLPLKAVTTTDGITLSESASRALYLVKDLRKQADPYKGPGAVKMVLYLEVNDTNPLNALEFLLKDSGKLFFDEVVLFSANINYDAEKGRVYVSNNPNVQFLLDNNETFLQPLRKRGMKVILSILGNWDSAGVAQLSDLGARQFAQELKAYCMTYNLDGIGFDDEYSKAPDLSNPLFAPASREAAARLLYETKKAIPDKTVMVYYLNKISSRIPAVDGVLPSEFVDYAVDDYSYTAAPMKGMTLANCSSMSYELLKDRGNATEEFARQKKEEGYGYFMFFGLDPNKYDGQVHRCQTVCKGLYDEELLFPTHYYKKNDSTRYKY